MAAGALDIDRQALADEPLQVAPALAAAERDALEHTLHHPALRMSLGLLADTSDGGDNSPGARLGRLGGTAAFLLSTSARDSGSQNSLPCLTGAAPPLNLVLDGMIVCTLEGQVVPASEDEATAATSQGREALGVDGDGCAQGFGHLGPPPAPGALGSLPVECGLVDPFVTDLAAVAAVREFVDEPLVSPDFILHFLARAVGKILTVSLCCTRSPHGVDGLLRIMRCFREQVCLHDRGHFVELRGHSGHSQDNAGEKSKNTHRTI